MSDVGRMLLLIGAVIFITGVIVLISGQLFPWFGRLPGDIRYETENVKIFIPITTMILISVVGTLVFNIFIRIFRR